MATKGSVSGVIANMVTLVVDGPVDQGGRHPSLCTGI